jgi:hypothetical protein
MSVARDTVGFFRTEWAKRFTAAQSAGDEATIKESTGSTFNETTKRTDHTYTNRYVGPYIWRDAGGRDLEYGEQESEIRKGLLHVPYSVNGIAPGMLVDLTSSTDADLDGLQVVIRQVRKDTYNTVRVLECEENQSD